MVYKASNDNDRVFVSSVTGDIWEEALPYILGYETRKIWDDISHNKRCSDYNTRNPE
jgi:hypothetical protein